MARTGPTLLGEDKLTDKIRKGEESLLPEVLKQQDGDEILLHPEGRDNNGPSPIGVARTGPQEGGVSEEEKLTDRIGKEDQEELLSCTQEVVESWESKDQG